MLSIRRILAGLRASRSHVRPLNAARGELDARLSAGLVEDEQLVIHELVQKHVGPALALHPNLAGDVRPIIRAREHLRKAVAHVRGMRDGRGL